MTFIAILDFNKIYCNTLSVLKLWCEVMQDESRNYDCRKFVRPYLLYISYIRGNGIMTEATKSFL